MYTLQGKTKTTRYMLSTLDLHMVLNHTSHMVHVGNLSLIPTRSKQGSTPGTSIGDQTQTGSSVTLDHLVPPPT
jgi:hypothetical protein